MIINIFYCHIDSSVNNLLLLYNELKNKKEKYSDAGYFINMIDVNSISIANLTNFIKCADVNVVDLLITSIHLHDQKAVPYNTVIKNLRPASHYKEIYEEIINSQCCKILFAQSFDLHWHGIDLDSLRKFDALFWLYEKEPLAIQRIPKQYHEKWFTQHEEPRSVWSIIRSKINSRAEIPFCVSTEKTFIKRKFFDYTVAGCNYQTRLIATNSLKNTSLRRAPFHYGEFFCSYVPKNLKLIGCSNEFANKTYIKLRRCNYQMNIERSFASFACGSGLCYPVRKFFQIPSYGSLLLAYPCVGFEDYGFIDGVNCVVTTPEEAGRNAHKIILNTRNLEKITKNGFDHVLREHSVENRLKQLIKCIQKIVSGKKINAQYINGQYEIQES